MNKFSRDRLFDPERVTDSTELLSPRAKKLYQGWLFDLKKGKTFFGLNWNWPSNCFDSTIDGFYDTYVFSWHVENWDHEWLKNFCKNHPDSQIIVISEFALDINYYNYYRDIKNLKCLVHHCWDQLIDEVLTIDNPQYVSVFDRKYKFSSLVNKPSYFKTLVTAYLMSTYDLNDTILSWNINDRQEVCHSMAFLDANISSADKIKPLIEFYHAALKNQKIKLDNFIDTRLSNYHCNIPAYTDCLVNSINETYVQSSTNRRLFPGPFITEKTWKPLLTGCGLLAQGPKDIYSYLENFGFVFDYPWDRSYDTISGDIDRFLKYLKTVDVIFESDHNELAQKLSYSSQHNYNHIRSAEFNSRIQELNQQYLSEFLRNY
jgi:hypothetical protein